MNYVRQVTNLDTGEKTWLDLGDHRPLTEVAKQLGIGERTFRKVLVHMRILHREWDDRSRQHRHRLTPGAVESGFGIRHDNKGFHHDPDRSPFDVLSLVGVEYVREHLPSALAALNGLPDHVQKALASLDKAGTRRLSKMTPEMRVYWLADHYPDLDVSAVAKGLGISETLVHRYRSRRARQIREAKEAAYLASTWWPLSKKGPMEDQIAAVDAARRAAAGFSAAGVET